MDPVVGLLPHARGEATFDLWSLIGRKSLQYDGARLLLSSEVRSESTRVYVCDDLHHAMPFGYLIPALSQDAMRRMLSRVNMLHSQHAPAPTRCAYTRPSHNAVIHMRALQAYDGICAGASHRQIASVLVGEDRVATTWQPDSELRAHVRYLIRRARFLVNRGYITLLTARSGKEGAAVPFANSP